MQYDSLCEMVKHSADSRRYFLTLPSEIQMRLHNQNEYIHTQQELRSNAEFLMQHPDL